MSVVIYSCEARQNTIAGHYLNNNKIIDKLKYRFLYNGYLVLSTELYLNSDSTFKQTDCVYEYFGFWILKNGNIIELYETHYKKKEYNDTVFINEIRLEPLETYRIINKNRLVSEYDKQKIINMEEISNRRIFSLLKRARN